MVRPAAPVPTPAPRVSDHALLRFLERAGGVDVEALRGAVAASLARASEAATVMGATDYHVVVDGLCFVVRSGVLVTVSPEGSKGYRARALRRDRA